MKHLIDECELCQIVTMSSLKNTIYGAIIFRDEKTHDWREPIIQHLKYPTELRNFAFHKELGVLQ